MVYLNKHKRLLSLNVTRLIREHFVLFPELFWNGRKKIWIQRLINWNIWDVFWRNFKERP